MSPKTWDAKEWGLGRSAREPERFARFYEEHANGVLAFIARRTFDVEVAHDLMAETFAQAFRCRRRFRGTTELEAAGWLFSIARHLVSGYVRTGVVERSATERLGISVPEVTEEDYDRVVELADMAELRAVVAEAFQDLRPDQREAVRLRVLGDLSYPEVASRLGISEPTARARVSRGLRQLAAGPSIREITA